ncbi:hypothetical protein DL771_012070 [Monosporascus sp. 5C6A]|nr:hypothetical protein DL771_012070 [Monosporascus sp. 5C6A]
MGPDLNPSNNNIMEAVGFASGVLTFLDVSYKIIKGTYEIHSAASGATLENAHVSIVARDLEEVADGLKGDPQKIKDPKLIEISTRCHSLSQDLLKLLGKLQAKDGSRRQSFKAAWAAMRKQSDVKKIEERLDQYRSEIELRLLFLLCTGDSVLKEQLEQIRQMSVKVSNQNTRALEDIQNRLDGTLRELQAHARETTARNKGVATDIHHIYIQSDESLKGINDVHQELDKVRLTQKQDGSRRLIENLDKLKALMERMPYENRILRRLSFESILRREEAITDPVANTYAWMLRAPASTMINASAICLKSVTVAGTLASEQDLRMEISAKFRSFLRGNGQTFFISGRAGCGKSTLMKFLGHDSIVREDLATWADGFKLVVVGIYFWGSDDLLQKSLKGFYTSILYHTLKQSPELIGVIFPRSDGEGLSSDAAEVPISELESAFLRLTELRNSGTHRFCYFVDGLDEYDGDALEHRKLAEKLMAWADSKAVKVVCSARPHTVFLDVFNRAGPTISFHQLTRSDIRDFAESQFVTYLGVPELREAKETCLDITEDIVSRADGVFLWASLVVRSLINGALEHENGECLRKRLQDCPDDLNSLFRNMLDRVDSSPWNRQCSNTVLYLATHNPFDRPLNALIYSWLPEVDWFRGESSTREFPFTSKRRPLSEKEILRRHDYVRSLLHRSTHGLIEMVEVSETIPYFKYRVDFFHRSARDYLRETLESRAMENPFPSALQKIVAYSRLLAAEAKFAPNPSEERTPELQGEVVEYLRDLFEYTFRWLADYEKIGVCLPPFHCVQEFGEIAHRNGPSATITESSDRPLEIFRGHLSVETHASWRWHTRRGHVCSFVHFASYWSQGSYVRQCLSAGGVIEDTNKLNLLLTASVATDYATTYYLLAQGRQPSDNIEITYENSANETRSRLASVWMVLLRDFANNTASYCSARRDNAWRYPYLNLEWMRRFAKVIEAHLRAGADRTVYFLIQDTLPHASTGVRREEIFRVDLYQMLDTFKPPNMSILGKLLHEKSSWRDAFLNRWSAGSPSQHARSGDYPSITTDTLLQMNFTVQGVMSKVGDQLTGNFGVRVY